MELHFEKYRKNTIGHHHTITTPYGEKNIVYADWIASGRLYLPIEKKNTGNIWAVGSQYTYRNQRNGHHNDQIIPHGPSNYKKACKSRSR
jgi:hypothetical protein